MGGRREEGGGTGGDAGGEGDVVRAARGRAVYAACVQ